MRYATVDSVTLSYTNVNAEQPTHVLRLLPISSARLLVVRLADTLEEHVEEQTTPAHVTPAHVTPAHVIELLTSLSSRIAEMGLNLMASALKTASTSWTSSSRRNRDLHVRSDGIRARAPPFPLAPDAHPPFQSNSRLSAKDSEVRGSSPPNLPPQSRRSPLRPASCSLMTPRLRVLWLLLIAVLWR